MTRTYSFDKQEYDDNAWFNTPMSTIDAVTDWAHDINDVYWTTTVVTVIIFFFVAIPLIITIIKFRAKPGDTTIPKQVHGHPVLELAWTLIPAVLLLIIAVPTWRIIFKQAQPPPENALRVNVIGHQWWWEFQYPELGITTATELHLPENRPIYFVVSSADVIHSFWVPRFGGKIDALPGKDNHLFLTTPVASNNPGGDYYQGQCVELCGLSHALMRFQAVVHKTEEFERWAKAHNSPPVVETAKEKVGEEVFARCIACHTIYGTPSAEIAAGKIGPDLTNFGSRTTLAGGTRSNTQENLAEWLRDPPKIKPGALMPNLGLTEQEIASVSAYIRNGTVKTF